MGKEPKGKEPKGDGRVNKGHFFQPGHLLARLTGVGGAAAASGITPAQADWPDDPGVVLHRRVVSGHLALSRSCAPTLRVSLARAR